MPKKWSLLLLLLLFRVLLSKPIGLNTLGYIQYVFSWVPICNISFFMNISADVSWWRLWGLQFMDRPTYITIYFDWVVGGNVCFLKICAAIFNGNHILMVGSCTIFSPVLFSSWAFVWLIFGDSGSFLDSLRVGFIIILPKKFLELGFPQQEWVLFNHFCLFFIFNSNLLILIKIRLFHQGNEGRLNIPAS